VIHVVVHPIACVEALEVKRIVFHINGIVPGDVFREIWVFNCGAACGDRCGVVIRQGQIRNNLRLSTDRQCIG